MDEMDNVDDVSQPTITKTEEITLTTTTTTTLSAVDEERNLSNLTDIKLSSSTSPPTEILRSSSSPLVPISTEMQSLSSSSSSSSSPSSPSSSSTSSSSSQPCLETKDSEKEPVNNTINQNSPSNGSLTNEYTKINGDNYQNINYNTSSNNDNNNVVDDDDDNDNDHNLSQKQNKSFLNCEESYDSITSSSSSRNLIIDHQDDSQLCVEDTEKKLFTLENKKENINCEKEEHNKEENEENKIQNNFLNENIDSDKFEERYSNKRKLSINNDNESINENEFLHNQKHARLDSKNDNNSEELFPSSPIKSLSSSPLFIETMEADALDGNLLEAEALKKSQINKEECTSILKKQLLQKIRNNDDNTVIEITDERIERIEGKEKELEEMQNNSSVANNQESTEILSINENQTHERQEENLSNDKNDSQTAAAIEPFQKCAQLLGVNIKFKCFKCLAYSYDTFQELRDHQKICFLKKTSSHNNNNNISQKLTIDEILQDSSSKFVIDVENQYQQQHKQKSNNNNDDVSSITATAITTTKTPSTSSTSNKLSNSLEQKQKHIFLCSVCGTYYEKWNLFLHMREIHKRHICLYCFGMFSNAERLTLHLEMKHDLEQNHYDTQEKLLRSSKDTSFLMCCICEHIFAEYENFSDHNCSELIKPCIFCNGLNGKHNNDCKISQKQKQRKKERSLKRKQQKQKIQQQHQQQQQQQNSNNNTVNKDQDILTTSSTTATITTAVAVPSSLSSSSSSVSFSQNSQNVITPPKIENDTLTNICNSEMTNVPENLHSLPLHQTSITTTTTPICDNFKGNRHHQQQQNVTIENARNVKLNGCAVDTLIPPSVASTMASSQTSYPSLPLHSQYQYPLYPPVSLSQQPLFDAPIPATINQHHHQPQQFFSNFQNQQEFIENKESMDTERNFINNTTENIDDNVATSGKNENEVDVNTESEISNEFHKETTNNNNLEIQNNSSEEKRLVPKFKLKIPKKFQIAAVNMESDHSSSSSSSSSSSTSSESSEEEAEEEENNEDDNNKNENPDENNYEETEQIENNINENENETNAQISQVTSETTETNVDNNFSATAENFIDNQQQHQQIQNEIENSNQTQDEMDIDENLPTQIHINKQQQSFNNEYQSTSYLVDNTTENVASTLLSNTENVDIVDNINDKNIMKPPSLILEQELDDGIKIADPENTPVIDLLLSQPLDKIKFLDFLRICLRATYPFCLYCNHARRIAVNGKSFTLHLVGQHRFSATVDSITAEELQPATIITKLKSFLPQLNEFYFNLETYCSYYNNNDDNNDKESLITTEDRLLQQSSLPLSIQNYNISNNINNDLNVKYDKIFECFQCRFVTRIHKELYLHNRKMHLKTAILCFMCKSNFFNYSEILCHICPGEPNKYVIFDIQFRCCLCDLDKIPSAFRLMVHLRKAHYACDVCLEDCQNQSKLSSHVWKHKLHHLCYRCGIAYRNKSDITKHLFWKHGTESVLCKRCLQKRWPHVYHFCIPPSIFQCEICNLTFSRAMYLKVHKRLHTGDAPYPCTEDNCDQKFISRKLLLKHVSKHIEEIEQQQQKKLLSSIIKCETDGIDNTVKDTKFDIDENLTKIKNETHQKDNNNDSCENHDNKTVAAADNDDNDERKHKTIDNISKNKKDQNGNDDIVDVDDQKTSISKKEKKKKKMKKESLSSKTNLDDDIINLPAPNLSESDSSDDEDKKIINSPKTPQSMTTTQQQSLSSPVIDVPKVMLSPPSDAADDDDDDEKESIINHAPVIDIWENFKAFQASQNAVNKVKDKKLEDRNKELKEQLILHVAQSDHDYCLMYPKTISNKMNQDTEGENKDKNNEIQNNDKEKQKINDDDDDEKKGTNLKSNVDEKNHHETPKKHDLEKNTTDDHSSLISTPSPRKKQKHQQQEQQRQRTGTRSRSESSESGSSSSSSSSCSCGSNCSCSSSSDGGGSSSDSSSSSDDSDSSTSEGRRRIAAKRLAKKEEKQRKRNKSENSPLKDTNKDNNSTEAIVDVVTTEDCFEEGNLSAAFDLLPPNFETSFIQETDLETDESDTDEDFYDEHPQKMATQLLAEKRKQLMTQTCLSPSHNFDIVENSRPSTPSLPEEVMKEKKVKIKKKKRERKTTKQQQQPPLQQQQQQQQHSVPTASSLTPFNFNIPNLQQQQQQQVSDMMQYNLPQYHDITPPVSMTNTIYPPSAPAIPPLAPPSIPQTPIDMSSPSTISNLLAPISSSPVTGIVPFTGVNVTPTTPSTPAPIRTAAALYHGRLSTGSNSDAEAPLKRSKRTRRPNKFYGYSSDDENFTTNYLTGPAAFKPIPPPNYTWRKEDLPTPSKSSRSGKSSSGHSRKSNQSSLTPSASPLASTSTQQTALPPIPPIIIRPGALNSPKPPIIDRNVPLVEPLRIPIPPVPVHHIQSPQIYPTNNRESQDDSESSDEDRLHIPLTQPSLSTHRQSTGGGKRASSKAHKKLLAGLNSSKALSHSPTQQHQMQFLSSITPSVTTPAPAPPPPPPPPPPKREPMVPPALLTTPPDFARIQYFRRNNIRYPIRPPVGARPPREGESIYCYCRCPYDEVSEMIACDGDNCLIEWFHFECVGILVPPVGKWFCPECRQIYQNGAPSEEDQHSSSSSSIQSSDVGSYNYENSMTRVMNTS